MCEVGVQEQDTRHNKTKVLTPMSFAVTCLYVVGRVLLLIGFFTLYAM